MVADSLGRGLIIWPIAQKLFQSVMLQQRPKWTGGLRIPVGSILYAGTRPTLPWDDGDRPPNIAFYRYDFPAIAAKTVDKNFALCALQIQPINLSNNQRPQSGVLGGQPAIIHSLKPMPALVKTLTGVTKDSNGTILPNCIVNVFRVDYDSGLNKVYTHIGKVISDGSGNYSIPVNSNSNYRVTADDSGYTVAGISFDTLTGS